MILSRKKNLIAIFICLGLILVYFATLLILKLNSGGLELNEFGDYIGGVLNPLFALLSTAAILFLTYIIAKNENKKADESIETQKRITITQMRQDALGNLSNKLNLFVYELDKIPVHDVRLGSFVQRVLTNNLKKEEKKEILVWLIIQYELEIFLEQRYLFDKLFGNEKFTNTYNELLETINKLSEEQSLIKMVSPSKIEKYIETKQELIIQIGDFILNEF